MVSQKTNRPVGRLKHFNTTLTGHIRGYKRNIPRKVIPGSRFGITQERKMVQVHVLFLQTNCN